MSPGVPGDRQLAGESARGGRSPPEVHAGLLEAVGPGASGPWGLVGIPMLDQFSMRGTLHRFKKPGDGGMGNKCFNEFPFWGDENRELGGGGGCTAL